MGDSTSTTILTRRGVALAMLAFAGPAFSAPGPCPTPRVLFVCPAGTVKSAIAREALKARAGARGVAVIVRSRGVHLEDHVSPGLAANLKADGIDPTAEPALALAPSDIAWADFVIGFDEAALAPGMGQARAWDIPSWNSDYASARQAQASRIEMLLTELAARPCPRSN